MLLFTIQVILYTKNKQINILIRIRIETIFRKNINEKFVILVVFLLKERERGHCPKFYNNVFLFFSLTTLGALVNFDWLIH